LAENSHFPHLFSPFRLGNLTIPNRVVMAPMSTSLGGTDGSVTPANIAFYRERAQGGFGLIIVEFTCVDPTTGRTEEHQLSLDSRRNLDGHKQLVEVLHDAGAKAFVQLQHGGRFAPAKYLPDGITRGPSEVRSRKDPGRVIVKPFEHEEILRLVDAFAVTAELAKEAGYDGIEVHGAHGYLLSQFMSPFSNQREDAWGGDPARRMALPLAVVRAIRNAIGDLPLSFRLSADEFLPGGLALADMEKIAPQLVAAGSDILHVSTGRGPETFEKVMEPISAPEGWRLPYARRLREVAGVPVIGVGQIRWPETAEHALVTGDADMIALGRPSLADPAWPNKAAAGNRQGIRPCTSCNWCISGAMDRVACAENPRAGNELEARIPADLGANRRAVVVGAGPAGMAGALMLREAGFDTQLIEADPVLAGGGLVPSATPPGKDKLFWFRDYLAREVSGSGVSVHLGRRATIEDIRALRPDVVFVATGTTARAFAIEGGGRVLEAYDVLSQHIDPGIVAGDTVVIYGGGETGCEAAEYCCEAGARVLLVSRSPSDKLARSAEMVYRIGLLARLHGNPLIEIVGDTEIVRVEPGAAVLRHKASGEERRVDSRHVLIAQGRDRLDILVDEVKALGIPCHAVGDSRQPGRIGDAVHSAHAAMLALAADGYPLEPVGTG
jgi:2,4-dienoyl-CoA reductase (NADPH2)